MFVSDFVMIEILTFDLWTPKSCQLILESKWMFVKNVKEVSWRDIVKTMFFENPATFDLLTNNSTTPWGDFFKCSLELGKADKTVVAKGDLTKSHSFLTLLLKTSHSNLHIKVYTVSNSSC